MLKKMLAILKNEDGFALMELIVCFFLIVIILFPLISAVFIFKDREKTLNTIAQTYLNEMLVQGGMSPSLKDELLKKLKKSGFDENQLDIVISPENAKPDKYNGHLQGTIPDSNLVYVKRGETIELAIIDKRRNRVTALKERYSDGASVDASYPVGYDYGMSEGL